jgi:hypothetical protein
MKIVIVHIITGTTMMTATGINHAPPERCVTPDVVVFVHNGSSLCNGFVQRKATGETNYDRPPLPAAVVCRGTASLLR